MEWEGRRVGSFTRWLGLAGPGEEERRFCTKFDEGFFDGWLDDGLGGWLGECEEWFVAFIAWCCARCMPFDGGMVLAAGNTIATRRLYPSAPWEVVCEMCRGVRVVKDCLNQGFEPVIARSRG